MRRFILLVYVLSCIGCREGKHPSAEQTIGDQKETQSPSLPSDSAWRNFICRLAAPYVLPPPEGVSGDQRHSNRYKTYYTNYARILSLEAWARLGNEDEAEVSFLISRPAPSIKEKYIAIGGTLKHKGDSLIAYEEKFWTWKMEREELNYKGDKLFTAYRNGESLTQYLTKNRPENDLYIEFPDDHTRWDTSQREWVTF